MSKPLKFAFSGLCVAIAIFNAYSTGYQRGFHEATQAAIAAIREIK